MGRELLAKTSPHLSISETAKPRRAALTLGEKLIDWTGKTIVVIFLSLLVVTVVFMLLSRLAV